MPTIFDAIKGLTTEAPIVIDKSKLLLTFATELGWTPSYNLNSSGEDPFVSIHLVVEHGLENSAVLSFLKKPFYDLSELERRSLLNISYNNLVDWHIHIDQEKATFVYNRNKPENNIIQELSFRRDQYESLRSDAFEKLIGKRINPNIPALDEALINTISHWKRVISVELDNNVSNESLSSLFNAIIFIRALEDNIKRYRSDERSGKVLLDAWDKYEGELTFTGIITLAQELLGKSNIPLYLLDKELLKPFNKLSRQTISYLFSDFYRNRIAGFYSYDFSIMSKHALSRIYEKYTALLQVEETDQLTLFARTPNEESSKALGAIYTPQYIARFFSRYLQENLSPPLFNKIKIAEPAVGSGIFLRTLLESKCESLINGEQSFIEGTFEDILGLDVDANACQAARLSLALLQLVLIDEFPEKLNIINSETLNFIRQNEEIKGTFDAVLSNPPFIATEILSAELKDRIKEYLGDQYYGRPDSYLAFLKAGVELLKPGGYGLYVIPHSFLIGDSAAKLRKYIFDSCWVRCLAELSAIPVFGDTGIYIILFIFQKKIDGVVKEPNTTIIKCRDFVGRALQDGIKNNFVDNPFYSVFEVSQFFFEDKTWDILPYREINLKAKMRKQKTLSEFLEVRQGFVTGSDDIFIVTKDQIPEGEEKIYIPYLPDRKIDRYSIPRTSPEYVIFPFSGLKKLEESELKKQYPKTWKYLKSKEASLKNKKAFKGLKDWWRPLRTRQPEHMLSPKIVTPHLSIVPKFSIDPSGKFGVSRSPFIISKSRDANEKELLYFFLAILNSTPGYWYISNHSHKYSKGYTMIEVKTLQNTPVPNPHTVPVNIFKRLIDLVEKRISLDSSSARIIDDEIDKIVCDLYNLDEQDRATLQIV